MVDTGTMYFWSNIFADPLSALDIYEGTYSLFYNYGHNIYRNIGTISTNATDQSKSQSDSISNSSLLLRFWLFSPCLCFHLLEVWDNTGVSDLADNGGKTPTCAIARNSQAHEHGDLGLNFGLPNPAYPLFDLDQRGFPRLPISYIIHWERITQLVLLSRSYGQSPDIGAFEINCNDGWVHLSLTGNPSTIDK